MATSINLPANWEELSYPGDFAKIEQAFCLLQSTYTPNPPAGPPTGFNYENLSLKLITNKMGPRQNQNGEQVRGLRIFQRIIPPAPAPPAIPPIDIVAFFFLRLRRNNPNTSGDAYCMTAGVNTKSGTVDDLILFSEVGTVCRNLKLAAVSPSTGKPLVDTFEIVNADNLPAAFASLAAGNVLAAAFVWAFENEPDPDHPTPPTSGKLRNRKPIQLGAAWRPNPNNSNATMNWWLLNP